MATRRPASTGRVWAALLVVYVVWGSTYLGIRVVVETMPPLVSMGARFLTAGALLAAIVALRRGVGVLRVTRTQLLSAGAIGALLLGGGNGGVAIAEQTVPSGLAALLVAAMPLWLVALRAAAGDRPAAATVLGTLVGFAGIALLSLPGGHDGRVQAWGLALILVATLSWASGSFLSGRLDLPPDPFVATVWQMATGGMLMVATGAARGELRGFSLSRVVPEAWWAWAYLVTFGSLAAYTAFGWLLQAAPLSLVTTYAYVNPVVAVILGAVLLAEPVTAVVALGGAVVVLGVGIVVRTERPGR